ncbi:xanthine/uracil permease family protein-like protein [Lindgomyces ingoldianus]|uniref:Xanthine/uracil permease family protein-like protein n=1 Tax=Lindgomyces ingoldianus TaxID=673940 RepID=A0ACB6QBC4_9PLEO|nr:xanthine/uracil permease family protein-like protein [Lindgomyces ingoldianus]KAF2463417.1 xanthine/uracil permease family protein-like protein [Lindgomyces ingoldianus]
MGYFAALGHKINSSFAKTTAGRIFRLDGSGHEKEIKNSYVLTEMRAGLTTFFTMAYIISVNAAILTDSGGICVCNDTQDATCSKDLDYTSCLIEVQRDLITATAAISAFASCLFGLLTNLPVALAPGMGLNAYFTYQVVGFHGTGKIPYKLALAAVFVEGWIFIFLALTGMRQWLVRLLPTSIKIASACGIGLFLALIGLSYPAGIGAITGSFPAPLDLGGCLPQHLDNFGHCTGHKMQNPALWIGIFAGGIFTVLLMAYKVKSAMILGILLVSIISWPRNTSFTYFPHDDAGQQKFDFFKKVVGFHPIHKTLNVIEWKISSQAGQFMLALITFLYVDILDCTATLYSMARFAGVVDPERKDFPRSTLAYCADAFCISIGSLLGLSPVTAFIESGSGIAEGGRTGLTAVTTGLCFIISIFFAPIFASIPPWATGSTLVLIGCMMIRQIVSVNWKYIGDAVPAFVTVIFIPFSYSIAYGLLAGLMTYIAINGSIALIGIISRNRVFPEGFEEREQWSYKTDGGMPWSSKINHIRDWLKVDSTTFTHSLNIRRTRLTT